MCTYTSYKVLIYPTTPSVLSITISIIPIFSLTTTKNCTIPFSSSNQVLIFRVHLFQLRTIFSSPNSGRLCSGLCCATRSTNFKVSSALSWSSWISSNLTFQPTQLAILRNGPGQRICLHWGQPQKEFVLGLFLDLVPATIKMKASGIVPVSKRSRRSWS